VVFVTGDGRVGKRPLEGFLMGHRSTYTPSRCLRAEGIPDEMEVLDAVAVTVCAIPLVSIELLGRGTYFVDARQERPVDRVGLVSVSWRHRVLPGVTGRHVRLSGCASDRNFSKGKRRRASRSTLPAALLMMPAVKASLVCCLILLSKRSFTSFVRFVSNPNHPKYS
jgi:hypothetical protein